MKKKIIHLSALLGLVFFAFIIYRIGPENIWAHLQKLSIGNFLILMGMRLFYWVLRTINWREILRAYGEDASLANMFAARMCSHSVTQLTPTAQVGGEAARIFMVDCSNRKISFASVVVDKTVEFLTVIIFCVFALVLLLYRITLPLQIKTLFITGVAVSLLVILFLISKQRKGFFGWLIDRLAKMKIRPKILERNRDKIKETDEFISDFYLNHRAAFFRVILLYSLLLLLWSSEIHLTLSFIGVHDITFLDSFLITMLGNLAYLFPFVPGGLGVYEVTYLGLFALLKRGTDVGLTMVLIRRILELAWAALGLLGMIKLGKQNQRKAGLT